MVVRAALRFGFGTASLLAGGWLVRALSGTPASLGASPAEIEAVAKRSPHFQDGTFVNVDPPSGVKLDTEERRMLMRELIGIHTVGRPPGPIPLAVPSPADAAPARLAVSWYGHSAALIEVDGYRVLADPIWSQRCSPSRTVGPQRMHEVPLPLEALPAVDAVVISHDHYDHLDIDTIIGLARTQRAPFVVPLGVGAHLRKWGIPESRIVELDWNEGHQIGDLTLVCTPARHFSGRLFTRDTTLWASWVIAGPHHRAFFGGDTGYTKSFTEIGVDHGPFDLTLLPIGAYHPAWPDIHMNPEEAVRAHLDIAEAGSGLLVPIHWATFRLAPHPWSEPVERLLAAADPAHVRVVVPKPGERVDPDTARDSSAWWQ
ncbi:MBL fold metallo-hydrolase [Mycobacterium sp.]|uniref:MBL fold metallo-hydrolase n=1 Tax=Mycobacterium sp. TaxID=1785 RepID=UPI002B62F9FC|nr:MBL fold metallo-hydrolase [Mycobacterium sp.]HKP39385.1 MBL fold metallo-hydrolase [Mycobacterium sp.]